MCACMYVIYMFVRKYIKTEEDARYLPILLPPYSLETVSGWFWSWPFLVKANRMNPYLYPYHL